MSQKNDVLEAIAKYAARFGLKPEREEENLVIIHEEYPIKIQVEKNNNGYTVELKVGKELNESIEELLNDNIDPRSEMEDVIETMVQVVDYAVRKLKEAGYNVTRKTRDAILDLYDVLESYLEEEEE